MDWRVWEENLVEVAEERLAGVGQVLGLFDIFFD